MASQNAAPPPAANRPKGGDLFVQLDEVDVHELPVHLMAGGDVNRVLQPPCEQAGGRGGRGGEIAIRSARRGVRSHAMAPFH